MLNIESENLISDCLCHVVTISFVSLVYYFMCCQCGDLKIYIK